MTNDHHGDDSQESGERASHPTTYPSIDRSTLPMSGKQPDATLEEAAAVADVAQLRARGDSAERERLEIITGFPLDDWATMPLERYALGLPESADGFCRWMEFNTHDLPSIKGGNALKHLILQEPRAAGTSSGSTARSRRPGPASAPGLPRPTGWLVRAGTTRSAKSKPSAQPYRFRRRRSIATTQTTCYRCAPAPTRSTSGSCLVASARSRRAYPQHAGFSSSCDSARCSRDGARARSCGSSTTGPIPAGRSASSRSRPGTTPTSGDDCLANGYIRIGWDEVGDIDEYASREQFDAASRSTFSSLYKGNGRRSPRRRREVWTLYELKPGDIVVANQGTSRIVGIGKVTEAATPSDRARRVRSDGGGRLGRPQARDIDPIKRWAFKTVAKVSKADYQRILAGRSHVGSEAPEAGTCRPPPSRCSADRRGDAQGPGHPLRPTRHGQDVQRASLHRLVVGDSWSRRGRHDLLADASGSSLPSRRSRTRPPSDRVWWVVANPSQWSWEQLFSATGPSSTATVGSSGTTRSWRATSSWATSRPRQARRGHRAHHRGVPRQRPKARPSPSSR